MAPSEPQLLATYEVFAAGYLMRPLGAMFFGDPGSDAWCRPGSPGPIAATSAERRRTRGGVLDRGRYATPRQDGSAEAPTAPGSRLPGLEQQGVEPARDPDPPGHPPHREQRPLDVEVGARAGVVADRQALVGPAEDDLGGHDEAR